MGTGASNADRDSWDKTYYRFRSQIEHENNLYNQRILWLIYIQALLFATLGLMTRARVYESASEGILAVDLMIIVICFLGAFIGMIGRRIVDNAGVALDEIRIEWSKIINDIPEVHRRFYLHVAGGLGSVRTEKNEKGDKTIFRSRNLPISFVVAWTVIFFIVLVTWFSGYAAAT
ncbi:MAG: hypothetical protein ABJN26_06115 [Stappiaceae bacterium]